MGDVTTRNTFVAGASDATKVAENFYSPVDGSPPDTLEVINGHLDEDNLDADVELSHRDVQVGTFVRAFQVGANTAFDLFDDLFGRQEFYASLDQDLILGGEQRDLVPIVGSSARFYVPWEDNTLLLRWSCFWATDLVMVANTYDGLNYEQGTVLAAPIYLYLDGARAGGHGGRRVAPAAVFDALPGTRENWQRDSRLDQRWNGHFTVQDFDVGWHTVSLRGAVADARFRAPLTINGADPGVPGGPDGLDVAQQSRIRCRSMRGLLYRG